MAAVLRSSNGQRACLCLIAALMVAGSGCRTLHPHDPAVAMPLSQAAGDATPRELDKAILPRYRIEPPDILVIEAVSVVPKSPYSLRVLDVLAIQVEGTLPDAPIMGAYPVGPSGMVNLGFPYGTVKVTGMTVDEAKLAVEEQLAQFLREPNVTVSLLEMAGKQQIAGEHMVGPDGTVTLGSYGSVSVVGATVEEAKLAIERHLSQTLEDPEISVDVFAYNSKVYYVITEGAGLGDSVTRFPVTGNETILDAISNVNGLTSVSSKRIWIARPTRVHGKIQILPVDWQAVTAQADPATNYQVMPGDRIFVAEDSLVAFDNGLAKLIAPFERMMGFSLLGAGTVTRFSGPVLRGGGNPIGRGGGGF
jgi:polysaccharide biosynthesis/export protein